MPSLPWERLPGESACWYRRFLDYLHGDRPRSFLKVYNAWRVGKGRAPSKTVSNSWNRAFDRFAWQARCDAFDAAEAKRVQQEYATRIELQRQRELQLADGFFRRAMEVLTDLPLVKEKSLTIDGESITVLPESRTFEAAVRMALASKELARAALEMTDRREEISGKGGTPLVLRIEYVNDWRHSS